MEQQQHSLSITPFGCCCTSTVYRCMAGPTIVCVNQSMLWQLPAHPPSALQPL
jgi:hypothetical protein